MSGLMTSSGLEWPFHASRAISAAAELLVYIRQSFLSRDAAMLVRSWES